MSLPWLVSVVTIEAFEAHPGFSDHLCPGLHGLGGKERTTNRVVSHVVMIQTLRDTVSI